MLSIAFTSLVIERGMVCKNLMIDRTQHEGPRRIFSTSVPSCGPSPAN